ncbi:protein ABHD15-like [Acanthaster planci]|uniref:Protein ABHD15-like n=1 Tax=Acanthaster planci TaxID=133434 RepID=A0A8B7YY73_ACAPL|nr:protein ABHD15-like [Acanthaster planci]
MNDASGPSTYCSDDQRGFCLASLGAASELAGGGSGGSVLGSQRHSFSGLRETALTHSMSAVLLGTLALFVALASVFGRWIKRLVSFSPKTLAPPKLYHQNSPLSQYLRAHCSSLSKPYCPTFWARNAHVQTLLVTLLPQKWVNLSREYLQMDDGGVVALDIARPAGWTLYKNSPIMIIVPDLNTDYRSVSDLSWLAMQKGYRVMVFNRRGHGGIPLTTPKLQSYGDASDLREVVTYIHQSYPDAKLSAVGIGAGGGLLIAFLGDYGSSTDLASAVCISPSYDCQELYESRKISQPYHWLALQRAKLSLKRHAGNLAEVIDPVAAFGASSLARLEEAVFAKIHKLPSMNDYWEVNNPLREADEISAPLLCLSSTDDPVHPSDLVPYDLFTTLPDVMLATTTRGGYCGFYEGLRPQSWAHRVAVDYIDTVLKYIVSIRVGTNNQTTRP